MNILPKLEVLAEKNKYGDSLYRVTEEIRVKVAPRWYVQVPKDYVSNFGSVPRSWRWFVSPGDFPGEFVLHDWMCNEDHVDDGKPVNSGYSRWLADAMLYELLSRRNPPVSSYKRWLIWFAVRMSARSKGLR